jgi:lipid II:glycine glycyltransferase (peptidoglycan interpeptide bridge formation enzyme)
LNVRDGDAAELAEWDALAVDAPGGHVLQSRAWAEHRRASGWVPRFLVTGDGGRVLALTRSWPVMPGGSAYVPRGPVAAGADLTGAQLAARLLAVTERLEADGIDVLASDAEVPAADAAYRAALEAAAFHPIDEIQPSRHRVSLPLGPDVDEETALGAMSKSTRQRIRGAGDGGVAVVRHDARWDGSSTSGTGEGFVVAAEPSETALDRFYDLLLETGERRHFSFGPRGSFVAWWRAALAAGHLVYLEAREASATGEPLAGLVLYRHGGRLSTVHSGDHATARETHPGALHLLRWRAIQLAIRERCTEMDLGGVDVAGARGEPREGDPLYGLYQHKRSFGGRWLELTGALERVHDPRGYAIGRAIRRLVR